MPVTPIADEIDNDIAVEDVAVLERQLRNEDDRLGVVRVHVEDRRLHDLRHLCAIEAGTRIERMGGREADLVVHDHMDCPPGIEASGLGQLKVLHDHALPGEGCVTMNQDRHHLLTLDVAAAPHPGTDRALDHRIHDLQMRGVEGERYVDRTGRRLDIRGEA